LYNIFSNNSNSKIIIKNIDNKTKGKRSRKPPSEQPLLQNEFERRWRKWKENILEKP